LKMKCCYVFNIDDFQCCFISSHSLLPLFVVLVGITSSKYYPPLVQVCQRYGSYYGSWVCSKRLCGFYLGSKIE
jgi:hypothetical protein